MTPLGALFLRVAAAFEESARLADRVAELHEQAGCPERAAVERAQAMRVRRAAQRARDHAREQE